MPVQHDQAFWTFSLKVYRDNEVQQECLHLQERFRLDVNLLLFCAYLGAVEGIALSNADIADAEEGVRKWHDQIVRALRQTRRALKPWGADSQWLFATAAEALRTTIKAAELESERIEQAVLAGWAEARLADRARGDPEAAVANNMRALLKNYGAPETDADLPFALMRTALAAGSQ